MELNLDQIFWFTVGLVFVLTLVSALIRRWKKDKCLKLFQDDHVTYLAEGQPALWGDLRVTSQGLEILFDSPYVTGRQLTKTSGLIYADELPQMVALVRTMHGLTPAEQAKHKRQLARSVNPGFGRRTGRRLINLINMVRDAIIQSFKLLVGRLSGKGSLAAAAKGQQARVTEVGTALLTLTENAYEPLLERYIGKPVILRVVTPGEGPPSAEFPGYLVDYNERYVALFNPEHTPEEQIDIQAEASTEFAGGRLELKPKHVKVVCTGEDALVLRALSMGEDRVDLGIALLPGQSFEIKRPSAGPVRLAAERTRKLDLICPRARARVHYASVGKSPRRAAWSGAAPPAETAEREDSEGTDAL